MTFTLPFELRGGLPEGPPVSGVRRMGGRSGSCLQRGVLPGVVTRAESAGQGGAGDLSSIEQTETAVEQPTVNLRPAVPVGSS
jgi:hypothetical protein